MLRPARLSLLLVGAVLVARPGWAQAFQGTVTLRTIRTNAASLTEDEQLSPDKVFAVPLEQVLAKARAGELRVQAETAALELKGSRMRSRTTTMTGANEMYVIADLQTGVFRSVAPAQRLYTEWTAEDLKKMVAEMKKMASEGGAAESAEAASLKLEPLGSTKIIAGFHCTGYRYTSGGTTGVGWLTKELADVATAFQRMSDLVPGGDGKERSNPWAPLVRYGFPCLAQQVQTHEGEVGDYEITELISVERRPVADDRFVVPTGFRKMTMPTSPP